MKKDERFESFPRRIVAFRATLLLAILATGLTMVTVETPIGGGLYLLLILAVMGFQMKIACSRCDYYNATCDLGISVLARRLMNRRADRKAFATTANRCAIPLFLLLLIPTGVSVFALVQQITLLQAGSLVGLIMLIGLFVITAKRVTCPRCRMNDICPLGRSFLKRA